MTQSPFKTVCYAIAVAMGVAVIVTIPFVILIRYILKEMKKETEEQ